MSVYRTVTLGSLLLVSSACVGTSGGTAALSTAARPRNVITAEEIRAASATNAYDLVRALRPTWLIKRGPQSVSQESDIMVYLDRTRLGEAPALREIPAAQLSFLEFLDPAAANFRFGAGHPYGAIVLSMDEEPRR